MMTATLRLGIVLCTLSISAVAAPKIIGDNSAEVKKHADLKPVASAYIEQTDREVAKILGMAKQNPNGQQIAAQSRKMNALADEGEPIGTFLNSPLHKCRAAGIDARSLWQTMIGLISTQTPQAALDTYRKTAADCRKQITNKPEPTVTVETPATEKAPPFKGCLQIISLDQSTVRQWTCPK